jgi:hypothetical protein
VTRINPAVIKEAFRKPAPSEAGYYILERGKTLVCLRVRKTKEMAPSLSAAAERMASYIPDCKPQGIHLSGGGAAF